MYQFLVFLAVMSAAMLVGVMTMLLTVMRVMWRQQSDAAAAASLHDFLRYAATNRLLGTLGILPVVCAIGIAFLGAPSATQYVYSLVGGAVFLVGFFVWTAVFNLPIYKAVSQWDLTPTPPEARSIINRFHRANTVRLAAGCATTMLYFLAG